MPVTSRLVQRLQETLGDDATDDLIAWFEGVGRVNQAAVREIADLYFQRFEHRLEQGLDKVRAEFRTELAQESARLQALIANQRADLIKWMFIFWAGTVIPLAGLILALHRP